MDKKERKKITWKDFGPEKIILIALAGIVLLVINFSERRTESGTKETEIVQQAEDFDENNSYIKEMEFKNELSQGSARYEVYGDNNGEDVVFFYPVWKPKTYTIDYNLNDNNFENGSTSAYISVDGKINYEKPEVPATDGGYVLTGTRNGDSVTYSWETSQGGGSTPDLSSYATKTWVTSQGYLTEHQDLTGYATQSWVTNQGYITSVPDTFATKDWVSSQGYLTEHQDLSSYALKSEIPSLDGYATQSWATSQFLEESKIWTGTQSAWDALSPTQQALYTIALITE